MASSNIFTDSISWVSSDSELEIEKAKFPQYEDAYVAAACIKERHEWIEKLWQAYKSYADDNFLIELKSKGRFNERTWEMYLGSVFLSKSAGLVKKATEGPDLHLIIGSKDVWIEATAPGLGTVDPAEERPQLIPGVIYSGGGDIEKINRPIILRIMGAMKNKKEEYQKNISKMVKTGDPYIIAINAFTFGGLMPDVDFLVRRSLFSSGCWCLPMRSDGSFGAWGFRHEPTVDKIGPSGDVIKVPTNIFKNDTYKEVSAILFSTDHIVNSSKDWQTMGDNVMLVKNPFAQNPLPNEFPTLGRECALEGTMITYRSQKSI